MPLTLNSIASPVEFLDHSSTLFVRLKNPATDELTSKIESLLDRFIKKSDRNEIGFDLSFNLSQLFILLPI
ncbi:MAG: hypothetical protein U5K54_16615 [Cytophagales bacterium]|nr:hypothetical protein [Cytophagales bacterium]